MAFGFGKNWWKRMSGLSNAQRKVSRAIGVPLSGRKSFKITNPLAWLFGGLAKEKKPEEPKKQAEDAAIAKENEKERQREELQKQVEDAAIARENEKERQREELKKQAEDAAIAKENRLEHLSGEIKGATKLHNECLDAWQQAGSPQIQQQALHGAKEKADTLLTLLRDANNKHRITSIKIGYLKLAYFTRKTASQLRLPWFVITLITGSVFFAFGILVALLMTNSLAIAFALAGLCFLSGSLPTLCLFFLPNNKEAGKEITILRKQESDQIEPLQAAKLAYEQAQKEYDNLASLHQLQTACERASLKKQRNRSSV